MSRDCLRCGPVPTTGLKVSAGRRYWPMRGRESPLISLMWTGESSRRASATPSFMLPKILPMNGIRWRWSYRRSCQDPESLKRRAESVVAGHRA